MGPTSAVIGKPNVHRKGRSQLRRSAQSGSSASGTMRPDSSISVTQTSSNSALTRVVQNVTIPRTHMYSDRNT